MENMKEFKIMKKSNTNLIRVTKGENRERIRENIWKKKDDNSQLINDIDPQIEES